MVEMSRFRSGELIHRIDIQALDSGQDSTGDPVKTYTAIATGVPALVQEKDGSEIFAASQVNVRKVISVRLRYFAGLTEKHRIVYNGLNLDIQSVINPDAKNIEHVVTCWWRGTGNE